jgi:hypothetical protein
MNTAGGVGEGVVGKGCCSGSCIPAAWLHELQFACYLGEAPLLRHAVKVYLHDTEQPLKGCPPSLQLCIRKHEQTMGVLPISDVASALIGSEVPATLLAAASCNEAVALTRHGPLRGRCPLLEIEPAPALLRDAPATRCRCLLSSIRPRGSCMPSLQLLRQSLR